MQGKFITAVETPLRPAECGRLISNHHAGRDVEIEPFSSYPTGHPTIAVPVAELDRE